MIICRNISSGKSFILIKEIGWNKVQVVTLIHQIKVLERHLFEDEVEGAEVDFLSPGVITAGQLKVYRHYKRNREDENQELAIDWSHFKKRPLQLKDSQRSKIQIDKNGRERTMKTIGIDDEVYAFLQSHAIPFEESTPNHVLRSLFELGRKDIQKELLRKAGNRANRSKAPKADLTKLVQSGILQDGQRLVLNYKGLNLSKAFEAKIAGNQLLFEGETYSMSKLVAKILELEGLGIPSKAYRGPEYWCNLNGVSVRQLWEKHLNRA